MSLPTDSKARKAIKLFSGVVRYFPDALIGVAQQSARGQKQHNLDAEQLRDDRSKSTDDAECIMRHLFDLDDMLTEVRNGTGMFSVQDALEAADAVAWRALRQSQRLREELLGCRLAPAAVEE